MPRRWTETSRRVLFGFFVLSGATGLLYQIVWVRMALAAFGVITPFASVVVSVFMLGLALGTWAGGRGAAPLAKRLGHSPLLLYGACESAIGLGAFALPLLFDAGRELLLPVGGIGSHTYLLLSSLLITVSMLPWCVCMGATLPLVMSFLEGVEDDPSGSFSYLYLANVIGAMLGSVATPILLIELLGFRHSLWLAAAGNLTIALGCALLERRQTWTRPDHSARAPREPAGLPALDIGHRTAALVLFATGFTAMALEIVWMRAFTPVLGTLVYAFSGLLAVYLLATWLGSFAYRRARRRARLHDVRSLVSALAVTVLLPALIIVPRNLLGLSGLLEPLVPGASGSGGRSLVIPLTLLSIFPFCALLGYLTPMLIDRYARGAAERAGRAYAVNIAGSILGPLVAAYLLLPFLGARIAILALAAPYTLAVVALAVAAPSGRKRIAPLLAGTLGLALCFWVGAHGRSFEEGSHIRNAVVRRDHTATVISYGHGFGRRLLVNGYGMTVLSPLTKVMAHLPLASLDHEPKAALAIAFGMGTTFRSLLSWQIDTTAVELVPSVVEAFGYYHADAERLLANPLAHVVIDDGRRFLARTNQHFDLITIDPPPPVETAGSSLLYAEEFYALAKRRLAPGGILQQWFPDGIGIERGIREAVLRALVRSFPYVHVFHSMQGVGLHVLCSERPIRVPDAAEFVARMPRAARRDLLEWSPRGTRPEDFVQHQILDRELPLPSLLAQSAGPSISDDRPFNEYFALRRLRHALSGTGRRP